MSVNSEVGIANISFSGYNSINSGITLKLKDVHTFQQNYDY